MASAEAKTGFAVGPAISCIVPSIKKYFLSAPINRSFPKKLIVYVPAKYEIDDATVNMKELACVSGVCEIL